MSFQILEFIVFELDTGEFYRESWNKGNVNYEIVDKELFYEKKNYSYTFDYNIISVSLSDN
jgi:hypothetical protein